MYWTTDSKKILVAFADGSSQAEQFMAFSVEIVKDGKIIGSYNSSTCKKASNGQIVYTLQGVGENTEEDIKSADSLLFVARPGTAVIIPNPVNDLEVKKPWEY